MCCTKKRQTQKGPAAKEEAEEANADGTFTYPDSNSPVAKVKKARRMKIRRAEWLKKKRAIPGGTGYSL
jgi:hypothetical protein